MSFSFYHGSLFAVHGQTIDSSWPVGAPPVARQYTDGSYTGQYLTKYSSMFWMVWTPKCAYHRHTNNAVTLLYHGQDMAQPPSWYV